MADPATGTSTAHAKPAFPPFDPSTFTPQLFWLAITFAFLFVMLERVALPRVARILKARQQKIAGDLDAAERARGGTEESLAAYEKRLADARAKAVNHLNDARARLKAEIDQRRAAVAAEIAKDIAAAEAEIATAHGQAMKGVRGVAVEVAGAVIGKVLGEPAQGEAVARAVDAELGVVAA